MLLLDDCFTTYNEPQIGRAAVRVLERAGYRVALAGIECCGRALLSKGFLPEARALVKALRKGDPEGRGVVTQAFKEKILEFLPGR